MTKNETSPRDNRRKFCQACIGGMTVTSLGAVGFPVVTFLGFPRRPAAERPVEIALDELAPGQATYVEQRGQLLIVLARQDSPLVLSAACTHLGCNVIWDAAEAVFRCPCHGAEFDSDGEVMNGPVNKALLKVPFEVKDGKIIVS